MIRSFSRRSQGDVSKDSNWAKARLNNTSQLAIRLGLFDVDDEYRKLIDEHFKSDWIDNSLLKMFNSLQQKGNNSQRKEVRKSPHSSKALKFFL